jgi:hypothetical protein
VKNLKGGKKIYCVEENQKVLHLKSSPAKGFCGNCVPPTIPPLHPPCTYCGAVSFTYKHPFADNGMRKTGKMPLNQLSGNFQGANIFALFSLLHIFFGPVD